MTEAMDYLGSLADVSDDVEHDERRMLLDTAERFLRESDSVRRFRGDRGKPPSVQSQDAWLRLCSLGVVGACMPEPVGGAGLAPLSGVMLAELFGRHLAPEPFVAGAFLPSMLLSVADSPVADRLLSDTAMGRARPAIAVQETLNEGDLVRPETQVSQISQRLSLSGRKRFVHGGVCASHFVVTAHRDGQPCVAVVARKAGGVSLFERRLADGTMTAEIALSDVRIDPEDIIVRGDRFMDVVSRSMSWLHVAVSAELFGLSTALFGMTIDYLRTRTQFDRTIGSFQALQHRAADIYSTKEIARFTISAAVADLPDADNQAAMAIASRCKARAADAAMRIARESVQLHGAIGFSDEADVGLYVNRIMVLSAWLGGADHHRRRYAQLNPYRMN